MILVRHDAGDDGVQRVVLLGRLESDDGPGLKHLAGLVGDLLPRPGGPVRMIISKLWPAEPAAVDGLAALGADLAAAGVACRWVGSRPEVAATLALAGQGGNLAPAGQQDLKVGAGWDGIPPFQLAPTSW